MPRKKGMTSFEIAVPLRDRMRIVSALAKEKSMIAWLTHKIEGDEKKFGIACETPPLPTSTPESAREPGAPPEAF